MHKRVIIILTVLLIILIALTVDFERKTPLDYNIDQALLADPFEQDVLSPTSYQAYLDRHDQVFPADQKIVIEAAQVFASVGEHKVLPYHEGVEDALLTEEKGSTTWSFEIPESGFYHVEVHYFPYPGKSSMIERQVRINDRIPFDGARNITFNRIWGNENEIIEDIHGNDIRPRQVEKPFWTRSKLADSIGYVSEPYAFHFLEGNNTLTFDSVREPLLLDRIVIRSVEGKPSYDEVKAEYDAKGYAVVPDALQFEQAERPAYTTSPTLYPLNDRTSPLTVPNEPSKINLNSIGGNNWRVAGDRIAWSFEVEKSGLYAISMRIKQKIANGMSVGRNIYIDGEIPFSELENYLFAHDSDWRIQTLGTKEEPFYFYLEEGTHEFAMEVSLGAYGPLIAQIQNVINDLNALYREILVYTGPEPDPYRDYQLEERIENLEDRLSAERDQLEDIRAKIIEIADVTSEKTGIIDTVLIQLEQFINKPRELHRNLSTYNANISSLGTLVILLSAHPLEIDYFIVHDPAVDLPKSRAGFLTRQWFSLRSFFASFTIDYASIGKTTTDKDEKIEVWVSVGRDQTNVLRRLIDESFTRETDIQVDLKLVNPTVLLPATLSRVGPDIAMGVTNTTPVNYAMRNAVVDLSQFPEFEDVRSRFKDSALVPYHYDGGYYALPEQQFWLMMFYRSDIFAELELEPPETWDDVIEMIPDLQKLNLEFYMPVPLTQGEVIDLPPNPVFSSMFYQADGSFYIENDRESGFNEGLGPAVFEMWSQFYTDYSFPVEANFVNRFRSGQMPIGLSYYNVYNTLSVFAPEIRGRWDFQPIPGTYVENEDGTTELRRDTVSTGTGTIILDHAENKEACWEFLKWWTSTEIQSRFGREMEGILGAAARYPTANVESMRQLPWTVEEYEKLEEQWEWVRGIPEVPGSYMTGRHLDNAFRLVLEERANPRETIYDYVQVINEEIAKKRREFGLD
ncbi:MAG: extracellular solute-binding protein [Acholeplasmataceae bacterium]